MTDTDYHIIKPHDSVDYQKMKDHDLLVALLTKTDIHIENVNKTLSDLKTEDKALHGRITRANERTDKKVGEVHKRVDKIKFWSVGSGGIGGGIGAFLAWLTSFGGK